MIKVITTTTVNRPTEAMVKFAAMEGWKLVIAGDKRTPSQLEIAKKGVDVHYISAETQERYDPELSKAIGWNCIQRRNFAFLFACKELKADIVATIDDDNIPMDEWGENVKVGLRSVLCDEYQTPDLAFDPLEVNYHRDLWHRGFPLELQKQRYTRLGLPHKTVEMSCSVQADLWNGDPDVDAICRMLYNTSDCRLRALDRPYTSNKPSPFNSQNTFISREVMPHYFMFPGIGRMDDIAASYHVQAQGFRVMYGAPTVVQNRNEHDIVDDLLSEVWGMRNNLAIVKDIPNNKNAVLDRLPPRSLEAFRLYQKHFE